MGGISDTDFPTPLLQLKAHKDNSSITLVCPKYFIEYYDHAHIKNIAQRVLGEYYGKAIKAIKNGTTYNPVRPSSITSTTNKVVIDFVGNVGNLTFDTTLVNAASNNGFDFSDDSGKTITSVDITDSNQITITLSGTPTTNKIVAYAYKNGVAGSSAQAAGNGERGNLRDSDTELSVYNNTPLYNWCVTFRESI